MLNVPIDPASQDLIRLNGQYSDLLDLVESLEKQLAAACEYTQVLIGLRTATEGGDRGSIFFYSILATSLSLLTL